MHRLRSISRVVLAGAALALAACADSTGPKTGPAAHVDAVSGNAQTGVASTPLAQPLVVKVTDANGRVVVGQAVSFVVTAGGGSVSPGSAVTDAAGMAQASWTLGPVAGSAQTVEARAASGAGQTLASAAFTATATVGAPAQAQPLGLDSSVVGVVSALVEDSFAVLVRDAAGNPVPGVQVAWAVTAGGGAITSPSTTDAAGVARTQWTLGASTGAQTATATVAGRTIPFTALPANQLLADAGNGQITGAGSAVAVTAGAKGAAGAVAGLRIHWAVASGGGSVAPAVSKTVNDPGGRALGIASAQWTLGPAGPQTLTATAGGLSVTFTATATPAGTRTLLAAVPGRVLDATADRVLWLEPQGGGPSLVKLRTLANGADETITASSGPTAVMGHLFSGGAIVYTSAGLFELRGGATASLGSVFGIFSAEGDWAAWSDGAQVIRRDLGTGTNLVIASARGFTVDVAANGDVAFIANGARLYHAGTSTPVSADSGGASSLRTDGVNLTYGTSDGRTAKLFLDRGANDVVLLRTTVGGGSLRMNAGWIAYSADDVPVQRRSPAGVVEQLSATGALLDALGADGTVIYRYARNGGRYYGVKPAGTQSDLGPAGDNDVVVVHGSTFFLLAGGAVYVLAP